MPAAIEIPPNMRVTLRSHNLMGDGAVRQVRFTGVPSENDLLDLFIGRSGAFALPTAPPRLWDIYPDAVPAIQVMHKRLSAAAACRMVPALVQRCERYHTNPTEVLNTLGALYNIHRPGNKDMEYDDAMRERVLSVALEMYGSPMLRAPQEQIREARKISWMRVIQFGGDLALTALTTTGMTCVSRTFAAAAYKAGAYATAQLNTGITATTIGAAAEAGLLGGAAVIASAALGLITVGTGMLSVTWWIGTIQAYQDTWDDSFARDAWLFHKMRNHHVLPDNGRCMTRCNHHNGDWTSSTNEIITYVTDLIRN